MVPQAGFLAFVCGILYEVLIDCAILGINFSCFFEILEKRQKGVLFPWKSGKNLCFFLGKAAKNDYVCPGKAAKMNL